MVDCLLLVVAAALIFRLVFVVHPGAVHFFCSKNFEINTLFLLTSSQSEIQ